MGGPLRRPAPVHGWIGAARTWLVEEMALLGMRRIVSIATALFLTGVVVWWLLRPAAQPVEASLPFASSVTAVPSAAPTTASGIDGGLLVVHVVGEVRRPGLVQVAAGARVADAVEAAGGATEAAQQHAVNLAAPVRDGQRIHIPHRNEVAVSAQPVGDESGSDAGGSGLPVNINLAGVAELDALPKIGPSLAAAIVAHRDRKGPFASVDQLLDVPGIGPATLEVFRALVVV